MVICTKLSFCKWHVFVALGVHYKQEMTVLSNDWIVATFLKSKYLFYIPRFQFTLLSNSIFSWKATHILRFLRTLHHITVKRKSENCYIDLVDITNHCILVKRIKLFSMAIEIFTYRGDKFLYHLQNKSSLKPLLMANRYSKSNPIWILIYKTFWLMKVIKGFPCVSCQLLF